MQGRGKFIVARRQAFQEKGPVRHHQRNIIPVFVFGISTPETGRNAQTPVAVPGFHHIRFRVFPTRRGQNAPDRARVFTIGINAHGLARCGRDELRMEEVDLRRNICA